MFLTPELMKKRPEKHVHSSMKEKNCQLRFSFSFPGFEWYFKVTQDLF